MIPEREKRGISVTSEFAGFASSGVFSAEAAQKLTLLHGDLTQKRDLSSSYIDFAGRGKELTLKPLRISEDLIMKVGGIEAFSREEMAVFIQEQARNYVERTTMGKGFPRGDITSEQELLSVFIDGFSRNDVLIVIEKERPDGIAVIAGARIVRGTSQTTLRETSSFEEYSQKGVLSSLPTFNSVKLRSPNGSFSGMLDVPEFDTACITRYWREDDYTMAALEVDNAQIPVYVIAAMPLAYSLFFAKEGGAENVPQVAVYDIHRRTIAEFARDNFASQIMAEGADVIPTKEVLNSVLKYHYGGTETEGYQGRIVVGGFYTRTFLLRALTYLKGKVELEESALQLCRDVIESSVKFAKDSI